METIRLLYFLHSSRETCPSYRAEFIAGCSLTELDRTYVADCNWLVGRQTKTTGADEEVRVAIYAYYGPDSFVNSLDTIDVVYTVAGLSDCKKHGMFHKAPTENFKIFE